MAFYAHGVPGDQPISNGFGPVGGFAANSAQGTAYNTSTTPTSIEPVLLGPTGFNVTAGLIPANFANQVGKCFRVKAGGVFGVTGTPTFKLDVLMGATVVATTGTQTGAAATSMSFNFECTCVVMTGGATGTIASGGFFQYFTTAPVAVHWRVTNSTAGTADTVDLTADKALHLQGTWGASAAGNNIRVDYFTVEFLN